MLNQLKKRVWVRAVVAALVIGLAMMEMKPVLERVIRTKIESGAMRHGVVARIGAVHVGLWPMLRLEGLDLDVGHGGQLHAQTVAATWLGHTVLAFRTATMTLPGGITLSSTNSNWRLSGDLSDAFELILREPQAGLWLRRHAEATGSVWNLQAQNVEVGRLLTVRHDDRVLLDGGVANGRIDIRSSTDTVQLGVDLDFKNTRVGALVGNSADDPQLGAPTDVTLKFAGTWQLQHRTLAIPSINATVAGAVFSGSVTLTDLDADPAIDLELGARQLDFTQLLGASGLEVPEGIGLTKRSSQDLGVATIGLKVRGRLGAPTTLTVSQDVSFKAPATLPPGITRLRGDFPFDAVDSAHRHRTINVSPTSPDFISLSDVPPLFLRTLLLAEDAGFYGHRGIDLRELPVALLTNWSRGTAARGASTISQQLAKNLFLSRDKQLGRKLQELPTTFLLESALSKARILEIYLNIIEWGPDLRGLRPAAHHYFGCEPRSLTPAQMAFLVSIIPGPIKYQSALTHGTPSSGLRSLIDDLLAKLRSIDVISEEEFREALNEQLVVGGEG